MLEELTETVLSRQSAETVEDVLQIVAAHAEVEGRRSLIQWCGGAGCQETLDAGCAEEDDVVLLGRQERRHVFGVVGVVGAELVFCSRGDAGVHVVHDVLRSGISR